MLLRHRRFFWPFTVTAVALFACGELRVAEQVAGPDAEAPAEEEEEPEGTGVGTKPEAGSGTDAGRKDSGTPPKDSGKPDTSTPPVGCDGPCPPQVLSTGLSQYTALTVDANNIYFAVEGGAGNGNVYQCPKTGCNGAPIHLGPGYATNIVVSGGKVYWGDFSAGKLQSCAIGGCGSSPTALVSNDLSIKGAVSDDVNLFWATSGNVRTCALGTCSTATAKTLATNQGFVRSMAADQGFIVWVNADSDTVYRCPAGSCTTPTKLGAGILDVSIHSGEVYWVTSAKNVVHCKLSSCPTPLTIGSSPQSPRFPVSDGINVYWRDEFYRQIYRCPATGCQPGPEIIATNQGMQPGGQIALDGLYVYWTTPSSVLRLKK